VTSGARRRWHAQLAWLPDSGVRENVLIEASGERFSAVTPGVPRAGAAGAEWLPGLTLPGFANAHSHAFHRALRGVAEAGRGTFWTWREQMYGVAARLDPDSYLALARAAYAEMALAGVSCVGEFHYLHHGPGGDAYTDPNAMGRALVQAAAEAGIRITLLDACYLTGGLSPDGKIMPLTGPQLRFGDGDGSRWAARATALGVDERGMLAGHARAGAAIHSVRAVPPGQMHAVVAWAHRHAAPLHVHLSEQRAENDSCLAAHGFTPTQVLFNAGVLGPRTTVVHATHVSRPDMDLLGGSQTFACICPTTERDLADGLAPAAELTSAGCRITVGTDSHAVIDVFEEARGAEFAQRLASQERGHFSAASLARSATLDGHACLGWPDAGEIVPGAWADLVTAGFDSPRLAGTSRETALESVIFGASAADVRNAVVGGRDVVRGGRHLLVPDVPGELGRAIGAVLTTNTQL
jgi:formiminoglutamate deiminase